MIDKKTLLQEVALVLERHLAELRKVVETSREMTRDAPGRIESRYDTSREETGWLATGQAALLGEWEHSYALFRGLGSDRKSLIQTGAFFEAEMIGGPGRLRCLVCHGGGGLECDTSYGRVTLVSPGTPLAEAALGRGVDDVFCVNGRVDYLVREVA